MIFLLVAPTQRAYKRVLKPSPFVFLDLIRIFSQVCGRSFARRNGARRLHGSGWIERIFVQSIGIVGEELLGCSRADWENGYSTPFQTKSVACYREAEIVSFICHERQFAHHRFIYSYNLLINSIRRKKRNESISVKWGYTSIRRLKTHSRGVWLFFKKTFGELRFYNQ